MVWKTGDEAVNNSTTLQNDDELLFAVDASSTYWFEILLLDTCVSTSSDFKADFTVPSGTTMLYAPVNYQAAAQWDANVPTVNSQGLKTEASTPTWACPVSGTGGLWMQGIVIVSGTAGNIQFRWAQNGLVASDTKILANSFIRYRKRS